MLNLFSFQDQKFGHKRRGAGHSGNNGHGGKEGGLLLSVPHLVSCKGHGVYGECWDGVKSLLKQCRTNLANMSTCTSPGDHTEYCSDIGKVASSICAMLWSFSQVFVLEPISYYDICRKCSASNRILSARDHTSLQVHIFNTFVPQYCFCPQPRTNSRSSHLYCFGRWNHTWDSSPCSKIVSGFKFLMVPLQMSLYLHLWI